MWAPFKGLWLASCIASGNNDTVRCAILGKEVPGHCQKHLTALWLCVCWKRTFFTLISLIVKSQQQKNELVSRPDYPPSFSDPVQCLRSYHGRPTSEDEDVGVHSRHADHSTVGSTTITINRPSVKRKSRDLKQVERDVEKDSLERQVLFWSLIVGRRSLPHP